MKTLKIKNKNDTEFIIDFDNTQEMIDFIINYTNCEYWRNMSSLTGVINDN